MLNLDAELIPGVSAAGITIGQSVVSILQENVPDAIENRISCRVLKYGPVWVFENYRALQGGDDTDTEGVVNQICVQAGYRGKVAGSIGIGSCLSEVEAAFGPWNTSTGVARLNTRWISGRLGAVPTGSLGLRGAFDLLGSRDGVKRVLPTSVSFRVCVSQTNQSRLSLMSVIRTLRDRNRHMAPYRSQTGAYERLLKAVGQ